MESYEPTGAEIMCSIGGLVVCGTDIVLATFGLGWLVPMFWLHLYLWIWATLQLMGENVTWNAANS